MIYREARPPRLGLAFSKDSTAHLPRDTAFLQDSASRPMYLPHFSRIPPRACRKMPHFSKIRPRARCKPRISPRFDRAPGARSNISPRFDPAPDVSPAFLTDSTAHPMQGQIFSKYSIHTYPVAPRSQSVHSLPILQPHGRDTLLPFLHMNGLNRPGGQI